MSTHLPVLSSMHQVISLDLVDCTTSGFVQRNCGMVDPQAGIVFLWEILISQMHQEWKDFSLLIFSFSILLTMNVVPNILVHLCTGSLLLGKGHVVL